MVLITIGVCVLFCLLLIWGVIWTVYENEGKKEPKYKEKDKGYEILPNVSKIIKKCLREVGAKDISEDINYFDFEYLNYKLDARIHERRINYTFSVSFKSRTGGSYETISIPNGISEIKKEEILFYEVKQMIRQIKTYKEDFNLLLDIKNNFRDLIVDEEDGQLLLEYNHIPITIRDFTRMFDVRENIKIYHGNIFIKSNLYSVDLYYNINNTEHFDSYNEEISRLDEVKPVLEEIESNLLYDLSNFIDAFRSMMNVRINGFTLNIDSLVVAEDYTMKFEYFNEFNTYYFKVRPFYKQYEYSKNDLDIRHGSFEMYESLLVTIKDILEESKSMVPFDTEEKPTMIFNNATGQLEAEQKKYLTY